METGLREVDHENCDVSQVKAHVFQSIDATASGESDNLPTVTCWCILKILISMFVSVWGPIYMVIQGMETADTFGRFRKCYFKKREWQQFTGLYIQYTSIFALCRLFVHVAGSIRLYLVYKNEASVIKREIRSYQISWVFNLVRLLAPILRFADSLYYAFKSRKAEKRKDYASQRIYYELVMKANSDAALIQLSEGILENSSVLAVGFFWAIVMLDMGINKRDDLIGELVNNFFSMLMMAWSMGTFHHGSSKLASENKKNISWSTTVVQTIWHFLITLTRIKSIGIFCMVLPFELVSGTLTLHWFLMSAWLAIFELRCFRASRNTSMLMQIVEQIAELLFCASLGFVCIFTYLTPPDNKMRYRHSVFFLVLCFLETFGGIMSFLQLRYDPESEIRTKGIRLHQFLLLLMVGCSVLFLFGTIFMTIKHFRLQREQKKRMPSVCPLQSNGKSTISPSDFN